MQKPGLTAQVCNLSTGGQQEEAGVHMGLADQIVQPYSELWVPWEPLAQIRWGELEEDGWHWPRALGHTCLHACASDRCVHICCI